MSWLEMVAGMLPDGAKTFYIKVEQQASVRGVNRVSKTYSAMELAHLNGNIPCNVCEGSIGILEAIIGVEKETGEYCGTLHCDGTDYRGWDCDNSIEIVTHVVFAESETDEKS